ncbi:MAG: sugar-binding domain-containing protein [Opitutaceae bacterium]
MPQNERSIYFNDNWQFHLGEVTAASQPDFDSNLWRTLRLPHDWSIELSYTQENAGGAGAFLPGGIGWYRKRFRMSEDAKEQITWIEFDGIYNNSEVWINGHYLGMYPYGYTPFKYDLTEHLNFGDEENVIAVRVDRSAYIDCRWYPGSGIYRDVKLVSTPKVHIPQWGTFITTPIANSTEATMKVQTTIVNQGKEASEIELSTEIEGQVVRTKQTLVAGATEVVEQSFKIQGPRLWDIENPNMYVAESALSNGDTITTSFGVRDIRYDKDEGFFLNGKHTVFKGVCLHHDGGAVGAAVPDGVWERRLIKLRELGCNAIRTAHNPPSEPFLDLCDRMGFLVQDEIFDEWDHPKDKRHNYNQISAAKETEGYTRYFRDWDKRDTDAMMLRDRNHPCIVMWGIGNEVEWTYPGYTDAAGYWNKEEQAKGFSYYSTEPPYDDAKRQKIHEESDRGDFELAETAARLAGYVRALDTTRPVTSNMVLPSVSQFSGYADVLDVDGYSYRQAVYQYGRERSPNKLIIGTENWAQWSEWKPVLENRWMAGIFLWPGITYLGESSSWPTKASRPGLLDLAGFTQPKGHYFKSLWCDEPLVHITSAPLSESNYLVDEAGKIHENSENPREPHWGWPELAEHWNHSGSDPIYVEVYSNCETVELTLNGRSIGVRAMSDFDDRIFRWVVPFEAGELKARAFNGSTVLAEQVLETVGEPTCIKLSTFEDQLRSDGLDVAHVTAQLIDSKGREVKHVEKTIHFTIEGGATNIGVDNGSSESLQDHKADKCTTSCGRCLLILQAGNEAQPVVVTANGAALTSSRIQVQVS